MSGPEKSSSPSLTEVGVSEIKALALSTAAFRGSIKYMMSSRGLSAERMALLVDTCNAALVAYTAKLDPEKGGIDEFLFEVGNASDYKPTERRSPTELIPSADRHNLAILSETLRSAAGGRTPLTGLPEGQSGFTEPSFFTGVRLVTLTSRNGEQASTRVFLAGKNKIPGTAAKAGGAR